MGIISDWHDSEIRYRLQNSKLRKWVNANPKLVIYISIVCVLLLFVVFLTTRKSATAPQAADFEKEWYYDLNTNELFKARAGQNTPTDAPSGSTASGEPAGVRAYVFTYPQDSNELKLTIGFLEKDDPNISDSNNSTSMFSSGLNAWAKGKLIQTIEDANWVTADSPKGMQIINKFMRPNQKGSMPAYYPAE